ncbi:MAG TPA: sigma 54-interacting transcriptional regulator [Nitrospiraceae bacterium]|nr:sigma 54-interacting transcriptional regulator [Nitrospiraceae bacterium]
MHHVDLNYRILLEVTNVLNSQRDTDSLWHVITEQIKQVIPWERAGITLYHPEVDGFKFYALETSMPQRVLQRDAVIPRAGSAVGWVYEHHRPHVRPSLQRQRCFLEDDFYAQEGLGRMINLPLLVRDTCLGTLNIGSVQAGEPHAEDMEFLRQVATQIAFAIDHVRAYEQINRLSEQLAHENEYLVEEIKLNHNFGAMVGKSESFRHVLALAQAVAPMDSTVLISGETGTGKELLARAIHELSPRRNKPFVRVNCAALPMGLVESELFGHERGAFTGADKRRLGRFELADSGTLFLDEIGEMPLEAQAKLLRVLQDGYVDRVGGTQPVSVNVRLIAATNSDLTSAIAAGRFRSDLFYRLHVFPIVIPPLRDRPEDIPLLARHFIEHNCIRLKRTCQDIEPDSLNRLVRYAWPGNVRELQNVIERAMILSRAARLDIKDMLIPTGPQGAVPPAPSPQSDEGSLPVRHRSFRLLDVERTHILQTLERTNWRIEGPWGAAKLLGLNPSTLRGRLRKLRIARPASPVADPSAYDYALPERMPGS